MPSKTTYSLEHFYYGQLVDSPNDTPQVLATTQNINKDQVAECARFLPPAMPGLPLGSWALVRGKVFTQFILVHAQFTEARQTLWHFVLLSSDALRALGGNIHALFKLLDVRMPDFEKTGTRVFPIMLEIPEAESDELQTDHILGLMDCTQNRIDVIESLLAGVVQGIPVVIQNAPPDVDTRISFIQGILALLPPSARFGVTFASHLHDSLESDSQIRFFDGDKLSRQTLVFAWDRAKVGGNKVDDEYSHFIISQLRLDTDLVVRQTRDLTGVAAWRIRRGDGLAAALGYAARRFKLDNALLNNQPVESSEVARVLAEDPTLSDDLKIKYTYHLLAFALALGNMEHADPIAVMLRQKPELEYTVQLQLTQALIDGKAGLVFDALSRWMSNPLGPVGTKWIDLTHQAMISHMRTLVESRDIDAINGFLEQIHRSSPGLDISRVVLQLIDMVLPLTNRDRDLNLTLFLMAVNYLESDTLRTLISTENFISQLPPTLRKLAPFLTNEDEGKAPSGLLVSVASDFGDEWRDPILIRLAESAVRARRPDILDNQVLGALVGLIGSTWGVQYAQTMNWIATQVAEDKTRYKLQPPATTYLLKLLLASGAYQTLATELINQSRNLYSGEGQGEYVNMIQRLFGETPVPVQEVRQALQNMNENGIKGLPLLMAHVGALEAHSWSATLGPVAQDATEILLSTLGIGRMIPSPTMLSLLRFHVQRKDIEQTIRVAGMIPQIAMRESNRGINLVARAYKMMDFDEKVRLAGHELLRRYVRRANDDEARNAIIAFGKDFGPDILQMLEATYLMRRLLDGVDLTEYSFFLRIAASLLYDTAVAYVDKSKLPTTGAIMNSLDSMTGSLNSEERLSIAEAMSTLSNAIYELGKHAQSAHSRDGEEYIHELLEGRRDPACGLDILWIIGGYLTRGKRHQIKFQRVATQHPFGSRGAPNLLEELHATAAVLHGATLAYPPGRKVSISVDLIRSELDSLWGEISLEKQRQIIRDMAMDFQQVAEVTAMIASAGNPKALEDNNYSRKLDDNSQQPKNTLELYRFVAGYFRTRA
jgi:hypothetical protein